MAQTDELIATLTHYVHQIEGPYRGYIIAGVLLVITALVTRFIFRTFKWFLLLVFVGVILMGGFWALADLVGI